MLPPAFSNFAMNNNASAELLNAGGITTCLYLPFPTVFAMLGWPGILPQAQRHGKMLILVGEGCGDCEVPCLWPFRGFLMLRRYLHSTAHPAESHWRICNQFLNTLWTCQQCSTCPSSPWAATVVYEYQRNKSRLTQDAAEALTAKQKPAA